MARFIPYDQTGFKRIDMTSARQGWTSGLKWLDKSQRHKPKDWSTPEGIATAINLTKAIAEHPIVDWVSGELDEATRGPAEIALPAGYKESRDASQEALQEVLAAETAQTRRMTSPEMLGLYRKFGVDVGDIGALREVLYKKYKIDPARRGTGDIRRAIEKSIYPEGKELEPGTPAAEKRQKEMFALIEATSEQQPVPGTQYRTPSELRRIQEMQQRANEISDEGTRLSKKPSTIVDSPSDLIAFVSEEGRSKTDLAWALKQAQNVARGTRISDRKRGFDPVRNLQKQILAAYSKSQRGQLTEAQAARLRQQQGNYDSLNQKRKDQIILQREKNNQLFGKWKRENTRKDRDVDSKIKLRDQNIQKIMGQISNAKTRTQRENAVKVAMILANPRAGVSYPNVYELLKQVAINSDWDFSEYLPNPDDINFPRIKGQRKGTGSGTTGKPSKKSSGEDGGDSLADYLGRWGKALDSALSVLENENATDDELLQAAVVVSDIKSQAGSHQKTTKIGKGEVRRGKDGVYFVHKDDAESISGVKTRATYLGTKLEERRSKSQVSAKEDATQKEARKKIADQQDRLRSRVRSLLRGMGMKKAIKAGWGSSETNVNFPLDLNQSEEAESGHPRKFQQLQAAVKALEKSLTTHGSAGSTYKKGQ